MKAISPVEVAAKPLIRHQNNFHFVRFIASILVLFGHSYALTDRSDWMAEITLGLFPSAHMGVCIFFVVSGYLITQSLENSPTITNFIWKRVLRIYPGLVVATVATILIVGPIATTLPLQQYFQGRETYAYFTTLGLFPPYHFELPGVFKSHPVALVNGSLWTLCYEVSFYALLIVLARLGGFKHRHWLLIGAGLAWAVMLLLGGALNGINRVLPVLNLNPFETLNFGLFFAAGTLARLYRERIVYSGWLVVLALVVWIGTYWLNQFGVPLTAIRWVRYPALSYIVLYICFQKGRLNRFGDWGDVSYGLYIYGFPTQQLLIEWLGVGVNAPLLVVLSIAATLPLAIGSWKWIEKPALTWKTTRT